MSFGRSYRPGVAWSATRKSDATTSNYPSLKHFFVGDRRQPAEYGLLDIAQDVAYDVNGWNPSGLGVISTYTNDSDGHNLSLSAGSWDIAVDKTTLLFIAGKFKSAFAYGIGDSLSRREILFSSGTNTYLVLVANDGVTVATQAVNAHSETDMTVIGAVAKPGETLTGFYTTPGGEFIWQAPVSMATLPTLPIIPDTGSIGGNGTTVSLYGMVVMQFDNLPSIESGIIQIHNQWSKGNFALPAEWQGV